MTHHLNRFLQVLLLLGGLTACSGNRPAIPDQLPPLRLVIANGPALETADPSGKAVLLNVWSSTCAVCLKEMPLLQKVHDTYKDRGLRVIALAMPYDRPSDAVELSERNQWTFHVAIDPQGHANKALGSIRVTPTTLLFDATGRRVWQHTGELTADLLNAALAKVIQ